MFTYYKKSREERAEDYRRVLPKLTVFAGNEQLKLREQAEGAVRCMPTEDLPALLEFINSKKAVSAQASK